MAQFKILSMDGGGSWALIEARILQDLYNDRPGHEILREFDLVIGNSGGSLVLCALCANMRPSEIAQIFLDKNKRNLAFVRKPKVPSLLKIGSMLIGGLKALTPKYSADLKLEGLRKLLIHNGASYGTALLQDMPKTIGKPNIELIIVGYDYSRNRAKFFRSSRSSKSDFSASDKFDTSDDVTLAEAGHASSNAPIQYFDSTAKVDVGGKHAGKKGDMELYWDGAVSGFNNPVLAGVAEFLVNHPTVDRNNIAVLSLGTAMYTVPTLALTSDINNQNNKDLFKRYEDGGLMTDISKMSTSVLADPPDSACYLAQIMLNPDLQAAAKHSQIVRLNPLIAPVCDKTATGYSTRWDYPQCYRSEEGKKQFNALKDLDMDATEDNDVAMIDDFAKKFITDCIDNQLVRGNRYGDRSKIIGQLLYSEGKKMWQSL